MLSDTKARNLKPEEKRYRVADSDGLYLDISPNGKKHWLFRYTENGKRHWHSIGEFPMVSLREARDIRDEERRALFDGTPPNSTQCTTDDPEPIRTFSDVALEWHEKNIHRWTEKNARLNMRRLEIHVFPILGQQDIQDIKPKMILGVAQRLETATAIETSHRVVQICSQVFRYAIAREYCENDPTYALRGALTPVKPSHFASLTDPRDVSVLLRNIAAYPQPLIRMAMQFSALVFLRPGEVRHTAWSEFDWDKKELRIPGERMKMKRPHIVPLSSQTLGLLEELRPYTGRGRYLFPNARAMEKGDRSMSENAVLVALRSMGYTREQMTAHGFRSMASTLLNENGFNRDWIERQLAHVEGNSVRAAYNYAEYLPERREMMQWWADYLDKLRGE